MMSSRAKTNQTGINHNEEDFMFLDGYRRDRGMVLAAWILIVCTAGIVGLVFYWRRDLYVKFTCHRIAVGQADVILLRDAYEDVFVSRVADLSSQKRFYRKPPAGSVIDHAPVIKPTAAELGSFEEVKSLKYFDCKRVRYLWNSDTEVYEKLTGIPDVPLSYFEVNQAGLNDLTRSQRLVLFGLNAIAIKVNSIPKILLKEGLTPFYAFQVFAIILWYYEPYTVYASVIVVISCLSLSAQVFETWRQQNALRKRVQDYDIVQIQRPDGTVLSVASETLVPGDIVIIPKSGAKVVCDAVLLSGHCIVNESSLTGESVPVSKVPVASSDKDQFFSVRSNNRSMLFCGTKVLQSRGVDDQPAKAMVVRTGFMTAKGELIRSIIFFRRIDFKFQNQTFWYIAALGVMAVIGMIYSLIILAPQKWATQYSDAQANNDTTALNQTLAEYKATHNMIYARVDEMITRTLDLVTIVVPPALPAALTVGIIFSQWRLQKLKIFCISPRTINMCGLLNMVCFDKTGTLTEDGLDLKSVLPSSSSSDGKEAKFHEVSSAESKISDSEDPMVRAMATCHSLSLMTVEEPELGLGDQSADLIGDPLDLIMFQFGHWKLTERTFPGFGNTIFRVVTSPFVGRRSVSRLPDEDIKQGLVIFREFPFASAFQRMGVIVFNSVAERFESFVKGSAEKVIPLCNKSSVPSDWASRLEEFSSKGNRVIALAWKPLTAENPFEANKIPRSDAERDLQFIGLVIFENRIKPDTPSVIEELYQANFRNVMLTGDNMYTAISVARTCGILRPQDNLCVVHADEESVRLEPVAAEAPEPSHEGKKLLLSHAPNGHTEAAVSTDVLGLTGDTLQLIRKFHPVFMSQVLLQGTVFARVSPLEKQFMVEQFQGAGYQVAMCGDGANDCGALRAAHAGISLSESEAAAAAPFTSTNPSIACVPHVLREGRCALVTFFGIFFLMATYSMTQFTAVLLLYWTGVTLTDWQFLYQDLFELTILAIVIAFALPYHQLTSAHPPSSLKSFQALFSLVGHVILILIAQIIAFKVVQTLPCDTSVVRALAGDDGGGMNGAGTTLGNGCERYATFVVGILQIVFLSFIFAAGPPFRRPFYTNYIHVAVALGMIAFDLTCMLGPTYGILSMFGMSVVDQSAFGSRFIFLGIALGYLVAAVFFDRVIVQILVAKALDRPSFKRWRDIRRSDVEDALRQKVRRNYTTQNLTYRNLAFSAEAEHVDERLERPVDRSNGTTLQNGGRY
ncbi:putative cation-transporting ATPase 13A3 [Hypsibius exemplaris]|uniref:Cation-transporting ATPase n=1 Tax=Hypsibius exemplaris TaxID=2072580 RepID=A0A9X6NIS5_HYPEX|nr:putative cation-transporting ATPase 13A3 [Hypsibius exemplaris]